MELSATELACVRQSVEAGLARMVADPQRRRVFLLAVRHNPSVARALRVADGVAVDVSAELASACKELAAWWGELWQRVDVDDVTEITPADSR